MSLPVGSVAGRFVEEKFVEPTFVLEPKFAEQKSAEPKFAWQQLAQMFPFRHSGSCVLFAASSCRSNRIESPAPSRR